MFVYLIVWSDDLSSVIDNKDLAFRAAKEGASVFFTRVSNWTPLKAWSDDLHKA